MDLALSILDEEDEFEVLAEALADGTRDVVSSESKLTSLQTPQIGPDAV